MPIPDWSQNSKFEEFNRSSINLIVPSASVRKNRLFWLTFSTFPKNCPGVIYNVDSVQTVFCGAKRLRVSNELPGGGGGMAISVKSISKHPVPTYGRPTSRTLLVDEDPSDVRYYFGILRALGHEVVVAGSYAEALAVLERENVDLAVVAQGGPAFEGRPVVAKALEINREMPVIVVARTLDIDCYLQAMEMGAADYLERCAAPRDFMRSVDANLQMKVAA